jgi:hypothetical protein
MEAYKLLQNEQNQFKNQFPKVGLNTVFDERHRGYINELSLFTNYFNDIPIITEEIRINCKSANLWLVKTFGSEFKDIYYNKRCFNGNSKAEIDDVFYFLYEDLIIDIDTNCETVRFLFKKTMLQKVDAIIKKVKKFKIRRKPQRPEIFIITNGFAGLTITPFKIKRPKFSIEENYNTDFCSIHKIIQNKLLTKDEKGIVLLHGKPGTGKTS